MAQTQFLTWLLNLGLGLQLWLLQQRLGSLPGIVMGQLTCHTASILHSQSIVNPIHLGIFLPIHHYRDHEQN